MIDMGNHNQQFGLSMWTICIEIQGRFHRQLPIESPKVHLSHARTHTSQLCGQNILQIHIFCILLFRTGGSKVTVHIVFLETYVEIQGRFHRQLFMKTLGTFFFIYVCARLRMREREREPRLSNQFFCRCSSVLLKYGEIVRQNHIGTCNVG